VHLGRILDHRQPRRPDLDAELFRRRAAIRQKARLVSGIDPGARHHRGAPRRAARIHLFDRIPNLRGREYTLLDQEFAQRRA